MILKILTYQESVVYNKIKMISRLTEYVKLIDDENYSGIRTKKTRSLILKEVLSTSCFDLQEISVVLKLLSLGRS